MSQEGWDHSSPSWAQRVEQTLAWEADRREEWTDLDRRLREVAKQRGALDAREAELLRDAEELKLWRAFGYASLLEYMERAMGYSPHTAVERLRVARALVELPLIAEALENGEIKHSAVRELTRVASSDTEAEWLDAIEGKSLREIEPMVAGRKLGSRPSDPSEPSLRRRKLTLELQPETYEMFRQAQVVLAEVHGHRLSPEEMLVSMLRMVLEPPVVTGVEDGRGAEGSQGSQGSQGAQGASRPAYQLAIKTCPDCKRSWQYGGGRDHEVGAEVVERARCDAEHLGSLDTETPARKTTTLTKRMREHVFARDGYACAVPGCRRVTGLDIHHIRFQEHGGGHEPSNIVLTCNLHHSAVHLGKLAISGRAPDALEFTFLRGHARHGIEDLVPHGIEALVPDASHEGIAQHASHGIEDIASDASHGIKDIAQHASHGIEDIALDLPVLDAQPRTAASDPGTPATPAAADRSARSHVDERDSDRASRSHVGERSRDRALRSHVDDPGLGRWAGTRAPLELANPSRSRSARPTPDGPS